MKKKFLLLIPTLIILLYSFLLPVFATSSNSDFDVLHYELIVNPRSDYSLDVEYNLEFKVNSEEITWIKIPIDTSSFDEITPISNNIDEIRYYQENEKHYIRVNFNQIFSKDDTIKLQFSIHQFDMENINLSTVSYNCYVINNFSNTDIKELVILWNSKNVLKASSPIINSDSFYTWNSSLKVGEKYNFFVEYDLTQFNQIFNEEISGEIEEKITVEITADSSENDDKDWDWSTFAIGVAVGVALTLFICYLIVTFY